MRFNISDPNKNRNIAAIFRQAGYHSESQSGEELAFYHSIHGNLFPRFHIYLKKTIDGWEANLHLDQKRPSYRGTTAHSGEYEGEVIEKEIERLKKFL